MIRGGVTRKVRIAMPGGRYDSAGARVRVFRRQRLQRFRADAFASTAKSAISAYTGGRAPLEHLQPARRLLRRTGIHPRQQHAETEKRQNQAARDLRQGKDGGRATAPDGRFGPENADFTPSTSQDPAPNISYTVTKPPKEGQVKVTVKFTSTAGVGEKTWTQPTEEPRHQRNQRHLLAAHGKRRIRFRSGRQRDIPALDAGHLEPPRGWLQTRRWPLHVYCLRKSHGDRHGPVLDEKAAGSSQ